MIATTEQRIPWLRGERRSAGAAGAVAARDQPGSPRRPLVQPLPRARRAALLVAALGLLVGGVALFAGPLADRCGPVGDVKRCGGGSPVPATPGGRPWTAAFEAVVPATGGAAAPATGAEPPAPSLVPRLVQSPAAQIPRTAKHAAPVRAGAAPVRRNAAESRPSARSTATTRERSADESGSDSDDSGSDSEDE